MQAHTRQEPSTPWSRFWCQQPELSHSVVMCPLAACSTSRTPTLGEVKRKGVILRQPHWPPIASCSSLGALAHRLASRRCGVGFAASKPPLTTSLSYQQGRWRPREARRDRATLTRIPHNRIGGTHLLRTYARSVTYSRNPPRWTSESTQTSWKSAAVNPRTPSRGVTPSPPRSGKAVGPQRGAWKSDWAPLTGEGFWERAEQSAVTCRGA